MTNINDEIRIREGDTNQTYSKLYVNDDKELHFVDSDNNDSKVALADGYNYITRSLGIPITGGFDYDASPAPAIEVYTALPYLLSGARLSGTYGGGTYQGIFSCGIPIPQDYHSGGQFKVYAVSRGTGSVHLEIAQGVIRPPDSASQGSFGGGMSGDFVVPAADILFSFPEQDLGEHNMQKGDIFFFRVYRYATDSGDTNTSDIYIVAAELTYKAEIPNKSF